MRNLSNLKKGQSGVVISINIENVKRKNHLLDMGLTVGTKVKVQKIAPSGDPISLKLRGYELCISKSEAAKIIISRITPIIYKYNLLNLNTKALSKNS